MIPILYTATETAFTSNGLGRLADATYCVVTEVRNGSYELELDYPVTGQHYSDIQLMRLIYAVPSDGTDAQPFEIYEISKPMGGIVTVKARHISYRLNKVVVGAFTASSCTAAIAGLKSNSLNTNPFTFWTDKSASATFTVKCPSALRGLLGGQEGSILDVYGTGEYEFDKFAVKLYLHRGINRGVTIRYGKNLVELTDENDAESVYTGVIGYYLRDNELVTGDVVYGSHRGDYPYDMLVPLDFTNRYDTKPTSAQLTTAATSYIASSDGWQVKNNIKISFVDLANTLEYAEVSALQQVNLCDTVTVYHEALGVSATAKVVRTDYDVLGERYNSIELGAVKAGLGEAITSGISAEIDDAVRDVPTTSIMEQAIANGTAILAGNDGGYIKIKCNANGKPQELLVMKKEQENASGNKIWRFNSSGIGYSSDGGVTYQQAWTIDGGFYTAWVTAGTISAGLVNAGVLQSADGKVQFDLDNSILKITKAQGLQITAGNIKVDSSGNVEITGKITATSGAIGGWNVTASSFNKIIAPTASTAGYRIDFASNPSSDASAAIRVRTAEATSGDAEWVNQFFVRYNGQVVANNAIVKGEITANSGRIGGSSGLVILNDTTNDKHGFYSGKSSFTSTAAGVYVGNDGVAIGRYKGTNNSYNTSLLVPSSGSNYSGAPDEDGSVIIGKLYLRRYPPWDVASGANSAYTNFGLYGDDNGRVYTSGSIHTKNLASGSEDASNYFEGETVMGWAHVFHSLQVADTDDRTGQLDVYGNIRATGSVTENWNTSDERLKTDIKPISEDEAIAFIMAQEPVAFKWADVEENEIFNHEEVHHGLIAQRVQKTSPSWDVVAGDGNTLGLRYREMIADLIRVAQSQERRITELSARIARLEARLEG